MAHVALPRTVLWSLLLIRKAGNMMYEASPEPHHTCLTMESWIKDITKYPDVSTRTHSLNLSTLTCIFLPQVGTTSPPSKNQRFHPVAEFN